MTAIVLTLTGVPAVVRQAPNGRASAAAAPALTPTDPTKVPHYFGPYPNWANSPQVIPNAVVTIDPPTSPGGVPAEAAATVDPVNGAITDITVTVPGSGYTSLPNITITAPGAHQSPFTGAAAVAAISDGALQSIAVDTGGFGYTAPVVTITGGTPATAATAQASGGVDDLALVDGGSGYQNQPIVEISLPDLADGKQATAIATMNALGVVTSITVIDAGSGYTKAPTVRILDGNADNPTGATVTATINIGAITILTAGAGFVATPTVDIADTNGGTGSGAVATATVATLGAVTKINVTTKGAGYLTPGLKKFVDTLPGLTPAGANNLGSYISVAQPDTATYPGTDYYEIGVVQYTHQFHTNLPPTLLRGYVQLSTAVVPGARVALVNENVGQNASADQPVMLNGKQVYGVDQPSYLGPTIVAKKDRPVRILFRNLLPTGAGGDLFLPVDTTLMGAGSGPAVTGPLDGQTGAMTLGDNGKPMMVDSMGMAMDPVNSGTVTDEVRNPVCGQSPKPAGCFTENRATLHLHGGITPWISDGTPHQWVTPAGEDSHYPKGVSVSNVPDMPDPGAGAETFFYTNQQSARLMFYHDHAWGITRLNVYAGEAAGYLITDEVEHSLFGTDKDANGNVTFQAPFADLGLGTPLIIQDKTFVPSDDQMSKVDPTWQANLWGHEGSLWTPHVYMPAQNPGDATGMSSFGRWMYGPWFWPPAKNVKYAPIANPYYDPNCDPATAPDNFCEPQQIPGTPNVTVGMEAFNDTPVVNGTAYPATTVAPKSYRYRILNAANDRFWNLQWYVADPTTGTLSEVALKPAEVAAAQTDPNVFPTPDTTKSPAGPSWIQIGTEGGFLPTPVVVPNQPTTWITDPTRFDVGNVDKHSLLLAPAERADVIVDFSQFRGKTLILYNDAPAAFPARVAGYDYYTGGPDLTPAGAPTTLPGYGPNTRTIMKVTVSSTTPSTAFDVPGTSADRLGSLMAAFASHTDATGKPAGVFETGQHPIIVGQAAYNTALGTTFSGSGWCNSPTNPSAKCDGYARIQEQGGDQFKFDTVVPAATASVAVGSAGVNVSTFTGAGRLAVDSTAGFPAAGTMSLSTQSGPVVLTYSALDPGGIGGPPAFTGVTVKSGAGALVAGIVVKYSAKQLSIPLQGKGIHDEMNSASFDEYGRMTANMGLEAPGATPLLQNIILYPYVNPVTEKLETTNLPDGMNVTPISSADDGTQIWKITHNGVDTHPIHFHLFDVQVINRVTWDGINIPPDATELGWKDTVRVSPLEDTIVAVRPIIPRLPFAIPDSRRPLNPMMPIGAKGDLNGPLNGTEAGFNNTDTNGNPMATPIANVEVNNGWEYVYHCHILSHEEMDMMRPVDVHVTWDPPATPVGVAFANGALSWHDGTPYDSNPATWNMRQSEIGFRIERADAPAGGAQGAWGEVGTAIANSQSFIDASAAAGTRYVYRVIAWNEAGETPSAPSAAVTAPAKAPTDLTATAQVGPSVDLAWTMPVDPSITSVVVERAVGKGAFSLAATLAADATSWNDATATGGSYTYRVHTVNAGGQSADAGPVTINIRASSTSLSSVANPSAFGTLATFTATVAGVPAGAVPTGTVTFTIDGTVAAADVPLVGGEAKYFTSTLPVGNAVVTADYSGDLDFAPSSDSLTQTVLKAPTSVTLTSDAVISLALQDVTLTATVAPADASGIVTFTFDRGLPSVATRTALVSAGVATFVTGTLTVGTHTVDASYGGDGSYLPSVSDPITQTITVIPTDTSVTSNRSPARIGQSITFTATVAAPSVPDIPSGIVKFTITNPGAADTVAVVALNGSGQATYTTSQLALGVHYVTASYGNTASFGASASAILVQQVNTYTSSVNVAISANPSVFGQTVMYTATMNTVSATGTVTFTVDGTRTLTGTIDTNGQARVSISTLSVGGHSVSAHYNGSLLYDPSTSATVTHTVGRANTNIVLRSSANPSRRGQTVSFYATVTAASPGAGVPTGYVRFTIDGRVYNVLLAQGGIARYPTRLLALGYHTVTATYLGSGNFVASRTVSLRQRIR